MIVWIVKIIKNTYNTNYFCSLGNFKVQRVILSFSLALAYKKLLRYSNWLCIVGCFVAWLVQFDFVFWMYIDAYTYLVFFEIVNGVEIT